MDVGGPLVRPRLAQVRLTEAHLTKLGEGRQMDKAGLPVVCTAHGLELKSRAKGEAALGFEL